MTTSGRLAALAGCAALLSACGGGSTPAASQLATKPAVVTPAGPVLATAKLTLKYPTDFHTATAAAAVHAGARTPQYINPNPVNLGSPAPYPGQIDIFLDGTNVISTPPSFTSDGTQTFSFPLYSTAAHQIVAVETATGLGSTILSIGESDLSANSFAPGDAPSVGLTMLMNVSTLGLMQTPNDSPPSASVNSNYNLCLTPLPTTFTLFPFSADAALGFVTHAGLGTSIPNLAGWSNLTPSSTNSVASVSTGLSTGFTLTVNDISPIVLKLTVNNPASAIYNDVQQGNGLYPGIEFLNNQGTLNYAFLNSNLNVFLNSNTNVTSTITFYPEGAC